MSRLDLIKTASRAMLPALLLLALAPPAQATELSAFALEILVDGRPLHEYAAQGKTFIEATEGCEYSIRLSNRTGRRVAVALSVDGLNTIDAKATTMQKASKWILSPYQTITLDGWQTSSNTARRFFFTTEEESYGAWLGKTKNLGIISAAVFREKRHDSDPIAQPAPSAPAESNESGRDAGEAEGQLSDRLAATGIGREEEHLVHRVRFDSEKSPAAVLELRYEYHDALVKLGVLPRPYARSEDPLRRRQRARGFEDVEFAPDPYR